MYLTKIHFLLMLIAYRQRNLDVMGKVRYFSPHLRQVIGKNSLCFREGNHEWTNRNAIKKTGKPIPYSFNCKMFKGTGTILILVFSSYTVLCDNLSESCGCTIETVDSFNNQRIPSRITEWYCSQPGAPCVSDHYRVKCILPYFL